MATVLLLQFPAAIGVQRSECVLENLVSNLIGGPRAEDSDDLSQYRTRYKVIVCRSIVTCRDYGLADVECHFCGPLATLALAHA
jgi:hypothetical protein